ncbi:MAG TPA: M67 family metallopeptidase [Candidatus Acidoferrales bacterium]|nr:M67 family metallopeptidase [Candidatus Acidoferrales bacterium]
MQGVAIRVRQGLIPELVRLAQLEPAHECCGLLGGSGGVIARIFRATNVAGNLATAYEMAPQELFSLVREIRVASLELMGIYHSHPNGKNEPSPRDIELAYYPDTAYLIVSPQPNAARPVRAFSIRDRRSTELDIEIV